MAGVNKREFNRSVVVSVAFAIAIAAAPPSSAQGSEDAAQQEITLTAGALSDALFAITDAFDVNILTDQTLTRGKTAPALSGAMTADEALARVLKGSDLTFSRETNGAYIISQQDALAPRTGGERSRAGGQPDAPLVLETVIVRGTKLTRSLQEIDTSVEVFPEARLDREEIVDLSDVLLRIPNVAAGGGLGNDFSIRGIGRQGATGAGAGIASNVYVDGAPISPIALLRGPLTLWDVGQIEVLRGSQSSVQGRNALAGAIVVSTNDPTYEPEGKLRVTHGRFDDRQIAGALSGPIIEDQVAARLAVDYQEYDGFITHVLTGEQADQRRSLLVRAKLLIEPKGLPGFSTKFTVDYADSELGNTAPSIQSDLAVTDPAFQDFDFFDFETFDSFRRSEPESFRVVNETTYDLTANWLVRSIFTYETTDVARTFNILDGEPVASNFTRNKFENEIFSAETRFEFDYENVRGLVGGYYYDETAENFNSAQADFRDLSPLTASATPTDSTATTSNASNSGIENFALFGQLDWDIDEHWRLSVGFRYDNERVSGLNGSSTALVSPGSCMVTVPGFLVDAPEPVVQAPCQTVLDLALGAQFGNTPGIDEAFSDRFEAFLPRAAITYSFDDDHAVFVSFQRGYRAGGSRFILAPTDVAGVNVSALNTYDPEYLNTVEIGTRNVFLDDKLIANANIFYSKYTDQQALITGPIEDISVLDDFIANAGESTLYGAEASLDYTLDENWNFFASVGLLDTEFDDFEFAASGPFQNLAGNEFPFAPSITSTFTANYEHESGFYGSGTFTYTGRQFSDPANLTSADFEQAFIDSMLDPAFGATLTEEIESRSDLSLRIGYRTDRFNVFAAGTNLLDEQNLRSRDFGAISAQTGTLNLSNNAQGLVFAPRSYRVGLEVNF